jgi:hypothetical protein
MGCAAALFIAEALKVLLRILSAMLLMSRTGKCPIASDRGGPPKKTILGIFMEEKKRKLRRLLCQQSPLQHPVVADPGSAVF